MCSSNSTSRDAARLRAARLARLRDDRAVRRSATNERRYKGALPLPDGFKKVHPVTEISNLQMMLHKKAKSDGSKEKSKTLGDFLNSARELKF